MKKLIFRRSKTSKKSAFFSLYFFLSPASFSSASFPICFLLPHVSYPSCGPSPISKKDTYPLFRLVPSLQLQEAFLPEPAHPFSFSYSSTPASVYLHTYRTWTSSSAALHSMRPSDHDAGASSSPVPQNHPAA